MFARALQVFWLGGALHARDVKVMNSLRALTRQHSAIVALLDPDPAGRQGRAALETAFGSSCLHAFVPGYLASASAATRCATTALAVVWPSIAKAEARAARRS